MATGGFKRFSNPANPPAGGARLIQVKYKIEIPIKYLKYIPIKYLK